MGNTLARNIRNMGAASESPNHRIDNGIQAIGEIGRSNWMSGLNAIADRRDSPNNKPNGTPTATAIRKLQVTRNKEEMMYRCRIPFLASSTIPSTTCSGDGK